MCERIINHIKNRRELSIHHKGVRLDKQLLRKIVTRRKELILKLSKSRINGIRISYNDKFILRLIKKEIREKAKKLKEQVQKEKKVRMNMIN